MPSFKFTQRDLNLAKWNWRPLILFLKLAITTGIILVLIHLYRTQLIQSWTDFNWLLNNHRFYTILVVLGIGLMINWSLEAYKWQILLSPKEHIYFRTSLKAVLSGIPIGLLTPGRIGEFSGRIWFAKNKIFATIATLCGNLTQLIITLLLGAVSWFFLKDSLPSFGEFEFSTASIVLFFSLLILMFFVIIRYKQSWYHDLIQIKVRHWLQSLCISFLRYLSFAIPFAFLLIAAYPDNPKLVIWMIPFTYLLQALLPVFALAEIGIRAVSIGIIAEYLSLEPVRAVQAGILIYFINVLIPAIVGLVIIWKLKPDIS